MKKSLQRNCRTIGRKPNIKSKSDDTLKFAAQRTNRGEHPKFQENKNQKVPPKNHRKPPPGKAGKPPLLGTGGGWGKKRKKKGENPPKKKKGGENPPPPNF